MKLRQTALFLFLCLPAVAQPDLQPELTSAWQQFFKLKVKTGETLVADYLTKNPADAAGIYLENYADFIRLLTSDDKALFEKLLPNEETRLKRLRNTTKNSPWHLFGQAEIRLQWAFLHLRAGHETQAALGFQKAYKLLEENAKKFPAFLPNKKTLGLLHICIGSVPEKYQWMTGLLGLTGSVSEGLKELDEVRNSTAFCHEEANLLFWLVKAYLLKFQPEVVDNLASLYAAQPDNLLLCFVYAAVAIKHNRSEEVIQVLHHRPTGAEYPPFYFLEYLKGEAYLQKNNYDNAWFFYDKFLKCSSGENLRKDCYYKIFLCNWLKDNALEKNLHYLDKVLTAGQARTEADKYAERFATKRQFPDPLLMKARLAFDGGYYEQGLAFLQHCTENSFLQPRDKAEFDYRLGRIYDKSGSTEKALDSYKRAILLSEKNGYYFGANAALQAGYLYLSKNDRLQARYYFEKALHFDSDEYRSSIRSKARTALKELE